MPSTPLSSFSGNFIYFEHSRNNIQLVRSPLVAAKGDLFVNCARLDMGPKPIEAVLKIVLCSINQLGYFIVCCDFRHIKYVNEAQHMTMYGFF